MFGIRGYWRGMNEDNMLKINNSSLQRIEKERI